MAEVGVSRGELLTIRRTRDRPYESKLRRVEKKACPQIVLIE